MRGRRIAFVVMQFSAHPWNLHQLIREELVKLKYEVIRADHLVERSARLDADHIWKLIMESDLVIVDVSNWNVNVFIELGVAMGWAYKRRRTKESLRIALIGDRNAQKPFDTDKFKVRYYNADKPDDIRNKIREAAATATSVLMEPTEAAGIELDISPIAVELRRSAAILRLIPTSMRTVVKDPAACLLLTQYVLALGQSVSEELAGYTGFPEFSRVLAGWEGADCTSAKQTLGSLVPKTPDTLVSYATRQLEELLKATRPLDRRAIQASDIDNLLEADRRLLVIEGITLRPSARTSPQTRAITETFSAIADKHESLRERRYPDSWSTKKQQAWSKGTRAIRRLTRLHAISVAPTELGTLRRIEALGSKRREARADKRSMDTIATLGGALFLGQSIAVLRDLESAYSPFALEVAHSTVAGQPGVTVPETVVELRDAKRYRRGLLELAHQRDFSFSVEHPFHFRVLLEVLSDENRRYPAEAILNYAALRLLWSEAAFERSFVWFRDQLPVVANFIKPAKRDRTASTYEQHYIGFGRTPHTSSFMFSEHEVGRTRIRASFPWPAALLPKSKLPLNNLPNSVAEGRWRLKKQRYLGRLWRGSPTPDDLSTASAELTTWKPGDWEVDAIADRLWDVASWSGLTFPELAIVELQCALWLMEALESRAPTPRMTSGQAEEGSSRRADWQAQHVLAIVQMFLREYLDRGKGDGLAGLAKTLAQLHNAASVPDRLNEFRQRADDLVAELRTHV